MDTRYCRAASPLQRTLLAVLLSGLVGTSVFTASAVLAADDAASATARARCPYGQSDNGTRECMSRSEFELTRSRQALLDANPGQYQQNALVRCEPLRADDRNDCVARMQGQGTRSGSVAGGGLYRELITVVPGIAAPAVPAAPLAPTSGRATQ